MFKEITSKEAVDFLLPRHYSGRKPPVSYAFGYYQNGILKAVCSIGKPASNSLCVGVLGSQYSTKVFELNRLCAEEGLEIPLSKFLGLCLSSLRKLDLILISYADTQVGHIGYIYQATNWIYTGATKPRTDKYTEGGKHSRHYDKEDKGEFRKYRSAKHRYIFFCANKKKAREYKRLLRYKIESYPKGDISRYVLGEFINPIVIKKC